MNYREDIVDVELTTGTIFRGFLNHAIGCGDKKADRFGIRTFRNGSYEAISGTCSGYFIRADGETVVIASGTVSGNTAYVELPEACYAVEGQFALAIKISGGGATGTLRIVDGVVSRTTTDAVVDPGTIIPSVETLIAEIEAAVASIPADYSDLWASLAPTFDTGTAYYKGDFVLYNGNLYRFKDDHAAGPWESNKVINITLGKYLGFAENGVESISNTQVGKQLCIADYAILPGVISTNLTPNTSSTDYRHIEYTVTSNRTILVAGRRYSYSYPGWIIADANNNVIDYQYGGSSSLIFAENITLPKNAAKVIVNGYQNNNLYLCEYTDKTIESGEIKTSLQNIGGKIVKGKAYKIDNTQTTGDYMYLEAEITAGDYYITGRNMGKNYPLFILLDSSNNINYYMGDSTEYNALNYKISVPSGTKKIIVNSSIFHYLPMIKKYVQSTDVNTAEDLYTVLNTDQREKVVNLVSVNPTITYGSVISFGQSASEGDNYMHTSYACTPGETYYVTGRHYSSNYPMIMFVNGNGDVCYTSGATLEQNQPYFDMKVSAPLDAVTLIVNSIKGWDIDIKVNGSETLYNTLQSQQLTGVYLGETPIKEIEYDLVNGSWVYNSAKAERNLSKFGYAYAIMLHRIMTTYPNATVICCTCNECERTTSEVGFPERNKANETIADYNNVIEKLAKAFGAMFVDHHSCGITYYNLDSYMVDYETSTGFGLHPNADGMALIAQKTVKELSGIDWTGKKVSVFGDSISTYAGTGSMNNTYPTGDVNAVGLTWWYKSLITELHMTLLTNGSGGGRSVSTIREGVTNRPKSGCNQDAIDALAVNGTSPDVIVIKQGINDFGDIGGGSNSDLNGHYYFGGL